MSLYYCRRRCSRRLRRRLPFWRLALRVEDAPFSAVFRFVSKFDVETAHLFPGVVSGARVAGTAGVAVGAGVRAVPSASTLRAATSSSASSGFSILNVEGLFLALLEADGVYVGVGVVGLEGRGEGR